MKNEFGFGVLANAVSGLNLNTFRIKTQIYLLMKEGSTDHHLRRSRRNYSDFQPKQSYLKNLQEVLEQQKAIRSKLTSIKINRHKLPADFFPKSQAVRKKVSSTRPSLENQISIQREPQRRSSFQQSKISPEKTSFFGFIQQSKNIKMQQGSTLSVKRQFESRNEPKRQKIYFEHRNFTPSTGSHRNDMLLMFPENYDQSITNALRLSKMNRRRQLAVKECQLKTKQIHKLSEEEHEDKVENGKQVNISTSGGSEDMHNITFYNAKSTCFPPINKNHNS